MMNWRETLSMIKRVLAFDFGTKRIGVAFGQTITMSARPLPMVGYQNGHPDWKHIALLIKEWNVTHLVVGLPKALSGEPLYTTDLARDFGKALLKRFNLPVDWVDERLTTKTARAQIFESGGYKALSKESIDGVAAQLILEEWFSTAPMEDNK